MCGRFYFSFDHSYESEWLSVLINKNNVNDFKQDEVFPGNTILAIQQNHYQIQAHTYHWGFTSFNNKNIFNARMETLDSKKMFSSNINNRCCIPCNGFYEFYNKEKYYIHRDEIMYLAGLYNDQGEVVVITGASENEMKKIHERTPILLNHKDMLAYINKQINLKVDNTSLEIEFVGDSSGNE